ncbi:Asp23/Gls24 family envelope stress response protein [Kitasatospora sp. NPDC052896]|uniref:Asp23/Gls24 family envelope stress response protein n=1 Tax=Kitasatospora sp. NPDC052896 TaxID=3364061 RepID=UPI0037C7EBBA
MPDAPKPSDLDKHAAAHTGPATGGPGRTVLADGVVEKIAGMAAREVSGIHALGSGLARTFGVVPDRGPGGRPGVSQGVKAEVGEKQAAIDIALVVEYGVVIPEVAAVVRRDIIGAVERMTGLEVVEVNIAVDDVHLPYEQDDDEDEQPPTERRARVQ